MLVLTVAKGPDRGAVFELRDRSDFRAIIGRNSPDLKLNDIMISRYHARLKYDGKRWILRDLGSRNGTKLNGDRMLKPAVLKTGDMIVTGYTEFAVKLVPEDDLDDALPPSWQHRDDEDEKAAASSADVAGAASSGFIPASVASGEIEHDVAPVAPPAPAPVASAPPVTNFDSVGEGSSGFIPAALASSQISPVLPPQPRVAAEPPGVHREEPARQEIVETQLPDEAPEPAAASVSISASSILAADDVPAVDEIAPPVPPSQPAPVALVPVAPAPIAPAPGTPIEPVVAAAPPVISESPAATNPASLSERPASEWMSAIESQIVVIDRQGWDDIADEEDDGFIESVTHSGDDEDVQPLDEDERSLLYFDEDDHWADDMPLDDEELINSLKEDGPDALLRDLMRMPAAGAGAVDVAPAPTAREEQQAEDAPTAGGKAKKKRKK